MERKVAFGLGILVLSLSQSCSHDERWLGFVYPDKNNLLEHKVVGEFPTLNSCLDAVNKAAGSRGSYECGLNCEDKDGSGLYICERTVGNEK